MPKLIFNGELTMTTQFKLKKLRKSLPILSMSLVASPLFVSASAFAQIDADLAAELRAQIAALSSRLEQLENENSNMRSGSSNSAPQITSWADKISISGDLRPRHELIDDDSKAEDRNRSRVRARLDIEAQVTDVWSANFGLASGGDDPISTNQTLGNGSSTKDIRMDYAYFSYKGIDNLTVTGGKYKNVFFKPGGQNLIFDGDLRPEGLGFKYSSNNLFLNAGTILIESDNKAGTQDKESMWGVQAGYDIELNGDAELTLGASYYNAAVAGSRPFYGGKSYSNSLDANGAYLYDFEEVEIFAEANLRVAGQGLRLFADYVTNLDADSFDSGWVVGGKFGSANGKGNWEAGYRFQDLEADAVFGAFTDSDFGNSGTDAKGHIITGAYGIAPDTKLGFTYFINEYGEAANGGVKTDYNRLQLDLQIEF
jgi:hypothetical protein